MRAFLHQHHGVFGQNHLPALLLGQPLKGFRLPKAHMGWVSSVVPVCERGIIHKPAGHDAQPAPGFYMIGKPLPFPGRLMQMLNYFRAGDKVIVLGQG